MNDQTFKNFCVGFLLFCIVGSITIIKTDAFGYGWRSRAVEPSLSKTISIYSNNGDLIKSYTSAGEVNVGRYGCSFIDKITKKRVEIQGNFVVE